MPVTMMLGGRNQGTSPSLISGITCFLKADTGIETSAGVPATNGQTVEFWRDDIAALDFKQATATNRPTYVTSVVNGNGVVRFDGVDNFMTTSGGGGLLSNYLSNANALVTGVARLNVSNTDVAGNPLGNDTLFTSEASNNCTLWFRSSAGNEVNCSGNDGTLDIVTKSVVVVSTWRIFTWYHTGGNLYVGVDGSSDALMSSVAHGNTGSLLINGELGRDDGGSVYTDIDIAEMAFFNTAVSDANRIAMDNYFKFKFGIT